MPRLHNKTARDGASAAKRLKRASAWAACKSQQPFAKQTFTLAACLLAFLQTRRRNALWLYWLRPRVAPTAGERDRRNGERHGR